MTTQEKITLMNMAVAYAATKETSITIVYEEIVSLIETRKEKEKNGQ